MPRTTKNENEMSDGWTYGGTDRWIDEQTDGRTDGRARWGVAGVHILQIFRGAQFSLTKFPTCHFLSCAMQL